MQAEPAKDELRSATATEASVSYAYDAFGRRIRRTHNGTSEYYLHDGDQVAADLDGTQAMQREYGWRGGVDELLSVKLANGTTGVAVRDQQLGATVEGLISVVDGSLLADYKSTPWGKPNDVEGFTLRYRMAGREYDPVTGLYYMRARYYDPQSGRFMSEDPVGIEGGLNLYSYAGLDPVNARDPFGKSFVCWTVTYTVYANAGYILWPDGKVDHVFESGVYSHDVRRCAYIPSGGGGGSGGGATGKFGGGTAAQNSGCAPMLTLPVVRRALEDAWNRSVVSAVEEGGVLVGSGLGQMRDYPMLNNPRGVDFFTYSLPLPFGTFATYHTHPNTGVNPNTGTPWRQRLNSIDMAVANDPRVQRPMFVISRDSLFEYQPGGSVRGCKR